VLFFCAVLRARKQRHRERERERERERREDYDGGELLRLLDMHISKLTEMEEVAECGN
jgi:hypothetical protein